jgi:hypothetical protein
MRLLLPWMQGPGFSKVMDVLLGVAVELIGMAIS